VLKKGERTREARYRGGRVAGSRSANTLSIASRKDVVPVGKQQREKVSASREARLNEVTEGDPG
jgi:hypothetical protein